MTDYHKHVVSNDLHHIWKIYSNPPGGVRLGATKPTSESSPASKRCLRGGCDGVAQQTSSPSASYICQTCSKSWSPLYRWKTPHRASGWLHYTTPKMILSRASKTRAWYATLGIFDSTKLNRQNVFDWRILTAYSLSIDIDVIHGTILDTKNIDALNKSIDYLKDVFSCCPESINLQTSGNGVYLMLHHSLCTEDIHITAGKFRVLLSECAAEVSKITKKRIKIDDHLINPSQVFKLAGSYHQSLPLVAIPLDTEVPLSKSVLKQSNPKHFDMHNFITSDSHILWYNNKSSTEASALDHMLDELDIETTVTDSVIHYKRIRDDGTIERTYTTNYQRDKITGAYVYSLNNSTPTTPQDDFDRRYAERCKDRGLIL